MLTVGISVTRDHLNAVVLESGATASRVAATASVPCREPYGGPEDHAALAAELRAALPGTSVPGAVITLPPSLTYLRPVTLPVTDFPKARVIHLAEIEGNLPIEDDEILSDLLPAAPEGPDTFLAVAARRSFVEKTVEACQAAGIRVDRVITDHTSLLLLSSGNAPADAILLSNFSDILLLRTSGSGVRTARQFLAAMADAPDEILSVIHEAAGGGSGAPVPVVPAGSLPAALENGLPEASPMKLPEGVPSSHLSAYGAALGPLLPKVAGGFSLRTSAEAAAEKQRDRRQRRIAGIAAGLAVVLAIGALEFAVWAGGKKVDRARALVKKEFAEAAPDVKTVVQAGTQIKEKVASLRRQQKEMGTDAPAPADQLSRASQSLPQGEIAVREISVEGGRLRIAGEAGEAKLVDAYRAGLATAFGPGYTVAVQGSEGSAKGSSVRFTILVEQKEDRRAS
jgi:type II secretion system protein L